MREIRAEVTKAIEIERAACLIGSSLQAEIQIKATEPDFSLLQSLSTDLRFVMITSSAEIELSNDPLQPLSILVQASKNRKCGRCWHHVSDVGADVTNPDLCSRCITNLFGVGEDRQFA